MVDVWLKSDYFCFTQKGFDFDFTLVGTLTTDTFILLEHLYIVIDVVWLINSTILVTRRSWVWLSNLSDVKVHKWWKKFCKRDGCLSIGLSWTTSIVINQKEKSSPVVAVREIFKSSSTDGCIIEVIEEANGCGKNV